MHAQLLHAVHAQLRERSGTANVLAPYTPMPHDVVEAMLDFAGVRAGDVLYDVGCGDARLLCAAVQRGAASAVGWDIEPVAIADAHARIARLGLGDRVRVACEDVFTAAIDWSAASVVVLYLSVQGNLRMRTVLLEHMRPGTRIVTVQFGMGQLPPTRTGSVVHPGHHSDSGFMPLFLYEVTPDMPRLDADGEIVASSDTFLRSAA